MLSEEEKREMKELAKSEIIREEFRLLRRSSQFDKDKPVDIVQLMNFLTSMSRLTTEAQRKRPFVNYPNVKL